MIATGLAVFSPLGTVGFPSSNLKPLQTNHLAYPKKEFSHTIRHTWKQRFLDENDCIGSDFDDFDVEEPDFIAEPIESFTFKGTVSSIDSYTPIIDLDEFYEID